ncbi:MFS transporter [Actinokineospora sp. 24-640]
MYYLLTCGGGVFFSMAFTLALVYQIQVVHLSPLQLVVIGTVMELTCLLGEVPTGIVADLYSRRLSVLIGFTMIGVAIVLQGAVPNFWWILVAQVIWGIGFTFTSGAVEAWITDELGDDAIAHVFTRGQQLELGAMVLGAVLAGALGLISLQTPIVVAGIGYLALAAVLVLVMTERNFAPAPPEDRGSFQHMYAMLQIGVDQARRRPVIRSFLLISLLVGLSSEAFDRLWTARILQDFPLPELPGVSGAVIWFTIFAIVGQLIGLATSLIVQRVRADSVNSPHPSGLLATLTMVQVVGILGMALSGSLWFALAALWVKEAARAVSMPLEAAWLNRNIDSGSRATMLSVNNQFNAIGQVVGGPPLGALAGRTSIPVALLFSAGILAPASYLFARLGRLRVKDGADPTTPTHTVP